MVVSGDTSTSIAAVTVPHQPSGFKFPQREFGDTVILKLSFRPSLFRQWPWLHYDEGKKDLAGVFFSCV